MAWNNFGWAGSGGSSGGGGGITIHGSSMHDSTVPSTNTLQQYIKKSELSNVAITPPEGLYPEDTPKPLTDIMHDLYVYTKSFDINPNLLYNSTGMMNMSGWIVDSRVTNYRDDYILDDYSFFVISGNNTDLGFICKSCPVLPNTIYTFSGEFISHGQSIKVSVGYQTQDQLNTDRSTTQQILLEKSYPSSVQKEQISENDWHYDTAQFTTPAYCKGIYLRIDNIASKDQEAYIRRLKIEQGTVATQWVPSLTDPYQNNVVIEGFNALDFVSK